MKIGLKSHRCLFMTLLFTFSRFFGKLFPSFFPSSKVVFFQFCLSYLFYNFNICVGEVICVFGWKTLFGGGSSSSSSPANRATSSTSLGTYRVIEGDPNLGSLHSLIRHASQWANVLPSFKSEWSKLPKEARTLVAKVEKGEAPAKGFFDSLAKLNLSSSMKMQKITN